MGDLHAGVQPAVGALDEHPRPGPQRRQPGRGVTDRGGGQPERVAVRSGGQRVGVGPGPPAAVEEAPGEELPAASGEPVQVAALEVHAGHRRRLLDDVADDQAVPVGPDHRHQHAEDEHRGQRGAVHAPPEDGRGRAPGEVRTGPQLVGERQAGAEVGVEVQQVPGLVAQSPPGSPDRGHHDHAQREGAGRGQQHAGGVQDLVEEGADEAVAGVGQVVAGDDQQDVGDHQVERGEPRRFNRMATCCRSASWVATVTSATRARWTRFAGPS